MTFVIAVDGGGSKTDAVAIAIDGTVMGRAAAGTSSPHFIGVEASVSIVRSLIRELVGDDRPAHAGVYLSGLDLEREVVDYRAALDESTWTDSLTVENDLFALLRAGTSDRNAAAVICGTGINALGIRADGAVARYLSFGHISGDWGGGGGIGETALWFAARDADGRGRSTTLTEVIPREFGLNSIREVSEALHLGQLAPTELSRLSPAVLEHSRSGDDIAQSIVDRQSEEIAVMAAAVLDRLDLGDHDVPVVLGGGVIQSGDARLLAGVDSALLRLAPRSRAVVVDAPPIVGAALLALESAGANPEAVDRARTQLA